jgi:hypothetical protein
MPTSFVQLPPDNIGKKLRTYDKGTPGHDQYVIPTDERSTLGIYHCQTGAHVIGAAADATTGLVGRWWLINPVGSAVLVSLERVHFMSQHGSALATPTSPRVSLERFAFTGTASGATVAPAKRNTADATNVASLRTASTGLTITGSAVGAAIICFLPVAAVTAVGACAPGESLWRPESDNQIILAAGEGIICRQPDAATVSDTRRFVTNIAWSEFTLP